jgi:hypothetical protein
MPPVTTTAQQPALSSNPRRLICPSRQPRQAATTRHDIQVAATAAAFAISPLLAACYVYSCAVIIKNIRYVGSSPMSWQEVEGGEVASSSRGQQPAPAPDTGGISLASARFRITAELGERDKVWEFTLPRPVAPTPA